MFIFVALFSSPQLPTKSPRKTRQLLQYVSCPVFQSNSLSKSAPVSCIKISKVKIWGELFKPTLFYAPPLATFVSKYFWTGKIEGGGFHLWLSIGQLDTRPGLPVLTLALSNRFMLFIVIPSLKLSLHHTSALSSLLNQKHHFFWNDVSKRW